MTDMTENCLTEDCEDPKQDDLVTPSQETADGAVEGGGAFLPSEVSPSSSGGIENEQTLEHPPKTPTAQSIETASEAKEPPPPDITDLCHAAFQKTGEYLQGELISTAEDYKLLEQMNRATVTKYTEMKHIAVNVHKAMVDLNEKYASLQPYLDQIDQIDESVASLEQAAYRLDAYSKRLENKFRQLEKR